MSHASRRDNACQSSSPFDLCPRCCTPSSGKYSLSSLGGNFRSRIRFRRLCSWFQAIPHSSQPTFRGTTRKMPPPVSRAPSLSLKPPTM